MSNFYDDIKKYCSSYGDNLLSRDEENFYGEIIQSGGEDAGDAIHIMWESNLRLVVRIVTSEYEWATTSSVSADDLLSAGNIGLRKAVEKFDPEKGNKFSTYARWWVKKEIEDLLSRNGNSSGFISMPTSASNKINKIRAAKWKFSTENGMEPSDEKISEMTNIPVRTVSSMMSMCDWHRGGIEYIGETQECYDSEFDRSQTIESIARMRRAMSSLTPIESYILIMRNGLHGDGEHTLEAISAKIGKTGERVRQIEVQANKKLAGMMNGAFNEMVDEVDYSEIVKEVENVHQNS